METELISELSEYLADPSRARKHFKLDYAQADLVHKAMTKLNAVEEWARKTKRGFAAAEIEEILTNDK